MQKLASQFNTLSKYIIVTLLAFSFWNTQANASSFDVGVQHASTDLVLGAQRAYAEGFRHITIWASPNVVSGANYPNTTNIGNPSNLVELFQSAPYQQVLNMNFDVITLTAYSFSTFSWLGSGSETYPSNLYALEVSEMSALVQYLHQNHPNKKFIIKNWEGDWHLIGSSYDAYKTLTNARVTSMRQFFKARSDGFYQGIQATGSQNIRFGLEFNLVDRAIRGQKNFLSDIVPYVPADVLAYSAWETINLSASQMTSAFQNKYNVIRQYGNQPLMVSEFGYSNFSNSAQRTRDALNAMESIPIFQADYWEMTSSPWGLVLPNGSINPALYELKKELNPTQPPSSIPIIPFAANFNTSTDGFRYLDDIFKLTNQPNYASGRNINGTLQVYLGGVDGNVINNMSGGWKLEFEVTSSSDVELKFDYNLTIDAGYESDEYSEVLVSIDGQPITNTALKRVTGNGNGGANDSSGNITATLDLGYLTAGLHTVSIGAFNNKKTVASESSTLVIDNVSIDPIAAQAPTPLPTPTPTPSIPSADFEVLNQLDFNQSSVYKIANSTVINQAYHDKRSISLNFIAQDNQSEQIIYEEGGSARGLSIFIKQGKVFVDGWNKPTNESSWNLTSLSAPVTTNTWTNVILVLNGTNSLQANAFSLYVDGNLKMSGSGSALWAHGDPAGLGGINQSALVQGAYRTDNVANRFKGSTSHFRLYNKVLSSSEISALAAETPSSPAPTPTPTPPPAGDFEVLNQLDFNRSSIYKIADSTLINTAYHDKRSISLDISPQDNQTEQVIYEEGGTTRGLSIYVLQGKVYIEGWNIPTGESNWSGTILSAPISLNTWTNVVLTLNGTNTVQANAFSLYINGSLVMSGAGSALWGHGDDIGLGGVNQGTVVQGRGRGDNGSNRFYGSVKNFRLYNRVLNSTEIGILANQ